jgi:hypothetical protein
MQNPTRKKLILYSCVLVWFLGILAFLSWKLNFSPEVDAAIISSIFSAILFCGTLIMNTYLTSEALKVGPKSQILFQERIVLYKELSEILLELNNALISHFYLKQTDETNNIVELHFRLRQFRRKSLWILPEDILSTLSKMQNLFSVLQIGGILFNPKCLETRETAIQFSKLYQEVINQMRRELDIKTISDVINHKIYKLNKPIEQMGIQEKG